MFFKPVEKKLAKRRNLKRLQLALRVNKLQPDIFAIVAAKAGEAVGKQHRESSGVNVVFDVPPRFPGDARSAQGSLTKQCPVVAHHGGLDANNAFLSLMFKAPFVHHHALRLQRQAPVPG